MPNASKKLIAVGNSFAVVIERPLLRALHYSRNTTFKVWTDGQRLILEPSKPESADSTKSVEQPAGASVKLPLEVRRAKAMSMCRDLLYRGLNADRLESLGAGYTSPRTYHDHLEIRMTADPVLEMVMDRVEHVHHAILDQKFDWNAAIESACNVVPEVPGAGDLGLPYEGMRGKPEYAHMTSHARRS